MAALFAATLSATSATPGPSATQGHYTIDATNATTIEYVWWMPPTPPRGVVLLAHGCRQTPRVWFSATPTCPQCIPKPEERCLAARLSEAGYALLAAGNLQGTKGCWQTNDVPVVASLLRSWRRRTHVPTHTPLFILGPSSGGFLAAQAARQWSRDGNLRGLSVQVSVPSVDDVSAAYAFPATQVVLLQKDSGKLKEAEALRRVLPNADVIIEPPQPVDPAFFSRAMPGLSPSKSAAVRAALVSAGHIDPKTSLIKAHPSRGGWRDAVRGALDGSRAELQQGSLQLTMDGIFARLDAAYAFHASTCAVADRTVAFFERQRAATLKA